MINIIGLGAITPDGDITLHGSSKERSGDGLLQDFDLKAYLQSPKTYLDRNSALTLAGCALALGDAGLEGPLGEEFGLVVGTQFGCVETMRAFEGKLSESGTKAVSPLLFSHSYFNSPASLVAIEWGLKGYHATVCGPDAGLQALQLGVDALQAGHAQRMIVGASDAWTPGRELGDDTNQPGEAAVFFVVESVSSGGYQTQSGLTWERLEALRDEVGPTGPRGPDCGAVNGLLELVSRLRP